MSMIEERDSEIGSGYIYAAAARALSTIFSFRNPKYLFLAERILLNLQPWFQQLRDLFYFPAMFDHSSALQKYRLLVGLTFPRSGVRFWVVVTSNTWVCVTAYAFPNASSQKAIIALSAQWVHSILLPATRQLCLIRKHSIRRTSLFHNLFRYIHGSTREYQSTGN